MEIKGTITITLYDTENHNLNTFRLMSQVQRQLSILLSNIHMVLMSNHFAKLFCQKQVFVFFLFSFLLTIFVVVES